MIYVWKDSEGNIHIATEKLPIVPDDAQVFDTSDTRLIVWDEELKQFRLKSLEERKKDKLDELKYYISNLLSQTDWVVIKLQSFVNEGWSEEEIQAEKEKYREILEQRRRIREWNRQMEQAIQNAQTLEELEGIRIEFIG